ncbi:unnamed protein product, partial [marine sediment metagenome]
MTDISVSYNSEIIAQLYADGSYYDMCPAAGQQNRQGTEETLLLTQLQQNYPGSDWSFELLQQFLHRGLRYGLYKRNCQENMGDQTRYFVNNGMVKVNSSNKVYADISPMICCPCTRNYQP